MGRQHSKTQQHFLKNSFLFPFGGSRLASLSCVCVFALSLSLSVPFRKQLKPRNSTFLKGGYCHKFRRYERRAATAKWGTRAARMLGIVNKGGNTAALEDGEGCNFGLSSTGCLGRQMVGFDGSRGTLSGEVVRGSVSPGSHSTISL